MDRKFLKASEAVAYPMATTKSKHGGTGLARLVGGVPFVSGGNGFYYPDSSLTAVADNGAGYRAALRRLFGR